MIDSESYRGYMQNLPESLEDIASAIGEAKVFELINRFKGQRIHIPKSISKWSLLPLLGNEAAFKLVQLCGGNDIFIPSCHGLNLASRNQKIRADRDSMKIDDLAAKYQLSRRAIQKIVNSQKSTLSESSISLVS